LAEVVDNLARVKTIDLTDVLKRTVWQRDGGLEVGPVDAFDGAAAWSFRALYHNRRDRPISLADCAALATCTRYDERIATSDKTLATRRGCSRSMW
jgi:predicted nucleic acid-binding protein